MITPSHSDKRFEANRVFTGRKDARALFRKMVISDQTADEYCVLMWYGVGGQGKSALFRECQRMLKSISEAAVNLPSQRKIVWARVDFEESTFRRPEEALRSIRLQMGRNGHLRFPAFDAAFTLYTLKTNPGIDIRKKYPELFSGDSEGIDDLIELTEGVLSLAMEAAGAIVPGANIVYKWGARLTGRLRDWWDQRGSSVLAGVDQLLPDELLERLPTFLGADLCDARTADPKLRPVILLDTYEALWRDRAQKDALSDRRADIWVRTLVQDSPGSLFTIFGRDNLRWSEIDASWGDIVNTNPLTELSNGDANLFLKQVPIEETKIRKRIVESARGLPFFLDLQVDLYAAIKSADGVLSPESFGGSHSNILDRFLDHLNESEQGALRLASYIDSVTQERMNDLVEAFPGRAANFRWIQLISRSFFVQTEDRSQTLHLLMREELQRREKQEEPMLFERIHRHLFETWEPLINPIENRPLSAANEFAFEQALNHLSRIDMRSSVYWAYDRKEHFSHAARARFLERVLRLTLLLSSEELGDEHPNTLYQRSELAWQLSTQGRYADAEAEYRSVYRIFRRPDVRGEEHHDTLTVRHNLAYEIGNQGRHAEAEAMLRGIYEVYRRPNVSGDEHLNTLTARKNLALQVGHQGMHAEAEAEFRAIYEVIRHSDSFSEDDKLTMLTRQQLAAQIGEQGRHAEAEAEYRATYEIQRRPDVLGEEDLITLQTRRGLARQIRDQGRYVEAEAEFRAIYEVCRRPNVLGEDHPHTLRTRFHLGKSLERLGKHQDADDLFLGLRNSFLNRLEAHHRWIKELDDYMTERYQPE